MRSKTAQTDAGRRILLLNGHPGEKSLSGHLLDSYAIGAEAAGHTVKRYDLARMRFDADFGQGSYKDTKPLEPDLERLIDDLRWAQHITAATPMWWGGAPGRFKGLLDRVLLPGIAFDPRQKSRSGLPKPLLSGRSARLIITSDTARWAMWLVYRDAFIRQMRHQVFGFTGISPMRLSYFAPVESADQAEVDQWASSMQNLGSTGC